MNSSKRRIEKLESASFDKVKEEIVDLNDITTTSFKYVSGTSTNTPAQGYSFYVTTIAINEYYVIQKASLVDSDIRSFKEYARQCYSGQWTEWKVMNGMSNWIGDNEDLNNYRTEGMYYCTENVRAGTISNVPIARAFSLLVERHAGVKQTFTAYDRSFPTSFVRNYYNGEWGNWFETSPIIKGSNSNGEFIKYPNGFMICRYTMNLGGGMKFNTQYGSIYYDNNYHTWTFPASFLNNDITVNITLESSGGIGGASINHSPTTTKAEFYIYSTRQVEFSNSDYTKVHLTAMGRWT